MAVVRCCLLLYLLVLGGVSAAACRAPLRVQVEHWPPYVVDHGDRASPRYSGYDVDVLTKAVVRAGCEIRFMSLPAERAMQALAKGDIDLMMAASLAPERETFAYFSKPYRREIIAVLGLPDGPRIHDWWDISDGHQVLLAPRHGYYGEQWRQASGQLLAADALIFYSNYTSAIAMLKAARADFVLGDVYALQVAADALRVALTEPLIIAHDAPVHFIYSRKSVSLKTVQAIDRQLGLPHSPLD